MKHFKAHRTHQIFGRYLIESGKEYTEEDFKNFIIDLLKQEKMIEEVYDGIPLEDVKASQKAKELIKKDNLDVDKIVGSGKEGRILVSDIKEYKHGKS